MKTPQIDDVTTISYYLDKRTFSNEIKNIVMASSIGIGNINIEPVELNSSALNLHNRIQVDPSLITGNDVYVSPTGGLTKMGHIRLYPDRRFLLSQDSQFI